MDRLRDAIAPMPSAAAVGATGKRQHYKRHGKLIGREARACGFNTVFAPVLDLALPDSQAVMRTRTFFASPAGVINYAAAFLEGLRDEDVLGCGKHFPGLGAGGLDSHAATPVIRRSREKMWQADIAPYRELCSKLPMVMVSHASYPDVGDRQPASVSRYWISEVLSRRIRYGGLIVSDDMEMGGILTQLSIEDAAIEAAAAGTHLIEICKDPALVFRAYESLLSEAESSAAFRKVVEKAARRVARGLKELSADSVKSFLGTKRIERLREDVLRFRELCPEPEAQTA